MKAKDLMNTSPVTLLADAPINDLIKIIDKNKVDGVCVVEQGNKLVGVVTIFELLNAFLPDYVKMKGTLAHVLTEGYFEKTCIALVGHPVRSIMRTDLVTIKEEANLISVIADIATYRLTVIPVIRGDLLVGTIHKKGLMNYAVQACVKDENKEDSE